MAAVLSIRKAAWDGLSVRNKKIVRFVAHKVSLGDFRAYVDPGDADARWLTFYGLEPRDLAVIGCLAANLGDLPGGYEIPLKPNGVDIDAPQLRSDIKAWLTNPARTNPYVAPQDVVASDPDRGVTPQDVLAAQGAPAALKAERPLTWDDWNYDTHGDL